MSSSVPEFIESASRVFGLSPETIRRCKVNAAGDEVTIAAVDESIRRCMAIIIPDSSNGKPHSIHDVLHLINYNRPWDSSLRERFLLLVTLGVTSQYWGLVVRRLFHQKLSQQCSTIAFFLRQNINDLNCAETARKLSDLCVDSNEDSVSHVSSIILNTYKRVQMKARYLSELDSNRVQLMSKIMNQMSIVDQGLLDCKYCLSVLFAAKVFHERDRIDSIIETEYPILKRLVKQHRNMIDQEAEFLNWIMSSPIDKDSLMQSSGDVGVSNELKAKFANIEGSINTLIESGMLPQLERRISSYLHSNDPGKEALVVSAKTASDHLLSPIEATLESNLASLSIENSLSALQSKYFQQRDELVRRVMRSRYRELQNRFVNRPVPTTETAERELRAKNVALLARMQEVASKESPYELRKLSARKSKVIS